MTLGRWAPVGVALLVLGSGCRMMKDRGPSEMALFPENGIPEGWTVTAWNDVSQAPPEGAAWEAKDGILYGSTPRGTWLVSDRTYDNFLLEFDFKLGPRGNSGVGLRFPPAGDPAFDGLEAQMVDPRYYPEGSVVGLEQLTGALYMGVAPDNQVYRPEQWNRYRILCEGSLIQIVLNGVLVVETELTEETRPLAQGSPLSERPLSGHIGFQELSRGDSQVRIRNATIREL